jgi:tetratricopeptide (TPR) repeat protein
MAVKDKKITRKEMRAPDEFQNVMVKVLEFFRLYGGWVAGAAVGVLVAVVAGVLLTRHAETAGVARAATFDRAFAPVLAADLAAPGDKGKEPDADALKKAADQVTKLKTAVADLDKVATEQAKDPLGRLALLGKAAAAAGAGEPGEAATAYQAFLAKAADDPFAFVAWEALGTAADAAGRRDEAEKAFTEMTKATSGLVRAYGWLHLGDLDNPATRLRADDPADGAKAKAAYEKGLKESGGEEMLMPPVQLLARKTLQERLATVR